MYTLLPDASVRRDADGAIIPADPANADRQDYEAWRTAGNSATQPAPPTPAPPETISEIQFMQQLATQGDISWDEAKAYLAAGEIPAYFQAAFDAMPNDAHQRDAAETTFIGAGDFALHDTATIALLLGKSDAERAALWLAAAAL